MSAAKRTLRRVISSWLNGESEPPQLLRRCETCGEKCWSPLAASILLTDDRGVVQLVIQLDGGSRLPNRVDPRAGMPLVVLRAATLEPDPTRWATLREFSMPAWRCRCAGTRSLSVDDDFSLRAIGCPIHLRHDGTQHFARVIEDCGRCAFFVGIGYVGADRRRIQLRCGFGAPPSERRPPVPAPLIELGPRLQIVAGS